MYEKCTQFQGFIKINKNWKDFPRSKSDLCGVQRILIKILYLQSSGSIASVRLCRWSGGMFKYKLAFDTS